MSPPSCHRASVSRSAAYKLLFHLRIYFIFMKDIFTRYRTLVDSISVFLALRNDCFLGVQGRGRRELCGRCSPGAQSAVFSPLLGLFASSFQQFNLMCLFVHVFEVILLGSIQLLESVGVCFTIFEKFSPIISSNHFLFFWASSNTNVKSSFTEHRSSRL